MTNTIIQTGIPPISLTIKQQLWNFSITWAILARLKYLTGSYIIQFINKWKVRCGIHVISCSISHHPVSLRPTYRLPQGLLCWELHTRFLLQCVSLLSKSLLRHRNNSIKHSPLWEAQIVTNSPPLMKPTGSFVFTTCHWPLSQTRWIQ